MDFKSFAHKTLEVKSYANYPGIILNKDTSRKQEAITLDKGQNSKDFKPEEKRTVNLLQF